jgi:beta-galactosidase
MGMLYKIDLKGSHNTKEILHGHLKMGGKNPDGIEINSNSRFITRGGKPWLPVMGEFHYSRYPFAYWEEELLKIKACGIDIVATYVFWIHHEEVKGEFDWTDNKDLQHFIQVCHKHGLYVYLRIGPWCHGECRNGGFPDWINSMNGKRTNDPEYLLHVKRLYSAIFEQAKGLLYKDGGPVIGIQIENELVDNEEHLKVLKEMVLETGFDVPLYTVTGWGGNHPARFPQHEVIPAFGDYADEPWEEHIDKHDPKGKYFYHHVRNAASIGSDILKATDDNWAYDAPDVSHYPYVTCEIGPGIQITHHRRPVLSAADIMAIPYMKLGCGSNMIGYYVFHGGLNPVGKLSTMQESKDTGYSNDYPIISYDFQAPVGEFGQLKEHYGLFRYLHMFINDFGSELAEMDSVLPKDRPADFKDIETLRFAARVKDRSGYLFFNNHQRNTLMKTIKNVQVELALDEETLIIPKNTLDIKENEYFILPFNMNMEGVLLKYSTTQPICKLEGQKEKTWFFFEPDGVQAEYVFDNTNLSDVNIKNGIVEQDAGTFSVKGIKPGTDSVVELKKAEGDTIKLVTLTQKQASGLWRGKVFGRDRLVLTEANVIFDGNELKLFGTKPDKFGFSLFPGLETVVSRDKKPLSKASDGLFERYTIDINFKEIHITCEKNKESVLNGDYFNYLYPKEGKRQLPEWSILLPDDVLNGVNDVFLRISFIGDAAQAYIKGKLSADCFYNGTPWDIGLKRFMDDLKEPLIIKISPLRKGDWVYLEKRLEFEGDELADIVSMEAIPEYSVEIKIGK